MGKRLRSSLQSSAQDFLSSVTKLCLKTSKPAIKALLHNLDPSSDLSSSLPLALHRSISHSILSLHNLGQHSSPPPSPANSPPPKRLRRSSRHSRKSIQQTGPPRKQQILDSLQILASIEIFCLSHPKNAFSPTDLLPSVQALHDNLIVFESDPVLSNEIANLCEEWWKRDLPGRETLISQSLPFLLSRSLTMKKKVDVHRVYTLRDAFALFDFEDDSIDDLKMLLMRCVISPLYMKTEEGRRFVALAFRLSRQLLKEALAMIKAQIPFGRKSVLDGYGEILFRAWKWVEGDIKSEIEDGFLQSLVEGAIHASSAAFAASVRRVLGGFITQRTADGVEKLLFRLAEPVIFRSLQVANSNVRQNALHLLLDLFPLEDPDATKEAKDTLLDKQFFLLERLLRDDCPDVRVVAVEGGCRVLRLFWEVIPSSTITKIITKFFDEMSHDRCSEVRVSTLNGIVYLLGNPQSHEILKVLLPRLGHLMFDNSISVRVAVADLLLVIRDIRTFQFNTVVGSDVLLSTLANDLPQVAQKITRLLMPSYFPSRVTAEEACNRCVILLKRNPMAGARFCEFALLEGASQKALVELVRIFVSLTLSNDKLDANLIEGFMVAMASLCKDLASESSCRNTLKELFTSENIKCLFAAASTSRAQSSVLDIIGSVSPDNAIGILENCTALVANCSGLLEDEERQAEVRSAHKLLLSCNAFDDVLETLSRLLQKAAYRCHIKFGTEIYKQSISSAKRKKCKLSGKFSAKWKHVSKKAASTFEEDYATAVGIAWQIKDLLISEDTRKAILGPQALELFLALKAVSEVSIVQCMQYEYMDAYPVLAYMALALHSNLQNLSNKNDFSTKNDRNYLSIPLSEVEKAVDHLLSCTEKLFADVKISNCGSKKHQKPPRDAPESGNDGSVYNEQRKITNTVKILTAVLKFIVDSTAMGFASHLHKKCLKSTSAYLQYCISTLGREPPDKLWFKEKDLKDIVLCLKSSFSYAAKFIHLVLKDTSETSPPPVEAFDLANDLLDLITSIELSLGSTYASRLVAVANSWLPDLILALGSLCVFRQTEMEETFASATDHIKLRFPSWPLLLAKIELHKMSEVNLEEEENILEPEKFWEFKKLMGVMASLLKGNPHILDAVGLLLLTRSEVGLERKDFGLVLGLLHFICVQLVGQEDKQWSRLDKMLVCLAEIYPCIEREIAERNDDDDERKKLCVARELLEPVWLYHVYETQRFTMMEE